MYAVLREFVQHSVGYFHRAGYVQRQISILEYKQLVDNEEYALSPKLVKCISLNC